MTALETKTLEWLAGWDSRIRPPLPAAPDPDPPPNPDLAAVSACPHRGPTLPHTQQPEATGCGCGSAELTECRAGRGRRPGAVTLAECLECVRLTGDQSAGHDVSDY